MSSVELHCLQQEIIDLRKSLELTQAQLQLAAAILPHQNYTCPLSPPQLTPHTIQLFDTHNTNINTIPFHTTVAISETSRDIILASLQGRLRNNLLYPYDSPDDTVGNTECPYLFYEYQTFLDFWDRIAPDHWKYHDRL